MKKLALRPNSQEPLKANKARVILKDLLGPNQMCSGPDSSLWAEFYARPAALEKRPSEQVLDQMVAGARYETYMQIEIEPFPLVA